MIKLLLIANFLESLVKIRGRDLSLMRIFVYWLDLYWVKLLGSIIIKFLPVELTQDVFG